MEGAKQSVSSFTPVLHHVLSDGSEMTRVDVRLYTGRTHQIRAHLAHIGFPIAGDIWYNPNPGTATRLMLHAYQLEFNHPVTGERRVAMAPLPKAFIF
jgi:23S rRNA pseudouridine1911/1915/1917 synthase